MKKSFASLFFTCITALCLTSCGENKEEFTYNYDDFYGICALTGESGRADARGLTADWTAKCIKGMNFKSMRFWITPDEIFEVQENDELVIKPAGFNIQRNFVSKCCEAGIHNALCMLSSFITPYGVNYDNGYTVPDPDEDPDLYLRFLKIQGKMCAKLCELFPEFTIIEPGNEPDFDNATCIHKDGFIWNGDYASNVNYLFSDTAKTNIIADMCWYIRKAAKEVNPNIKVTIPGLTNLSHSPKFLGKIYESIESRKLPFGEQYSDTDPDNYFDVLNWHPYALNTEAGHGGAGGAGPLEEKWIAFNKTMYQVAIDHGDNGKPVIFSELGWSTLETQGEDEIKACQSIAKVAVEGAKTIRKELPWVESIYYFRLTNIYPWMASASESTFGLFYNPLDPEHNGAPRIQAKEIAKLINGDDYVLEDHLN